MSNVSTMSVAAAHEVAVLSMNFCKGADCINCLQDDCDREATIRASRSHDFDWESHMDLLLSGTYKEVV